MASMKTPNNSDTPAEAATVQNHNQILDALLERYLHLIDDYSRLREDHNKLQSSVYQHIARANFGAERGTWYGRDYYDERMQAASTVSVSVGTSGTGPQEAGHTPLPRFSSVRRRNDGSRQRKQDETTHKEVAQTLKDITTEPEGTKKNLVEPSSSLLEKPAASEKSEKQESPIPVDPIWWFGLMAPMSLRQAQAQSIRAVDEIVPRLATVAAEMAEIEIEVRRARKRRTKAISATAKIPTEPNGPSVAAISA